MPGRNVSYVYLHTFSNGKCYVGINRKGIKASYYGKGMHVIMDGVKYVSVGDALKTLGRSRGGMGVKRKLDKYGRCTSKIKGVPHYFEVVK